MEEEETLLDVLIDVSKFLRSKGYKFSLIGGVAYSIVFEPRATFFHREKLIFRCKEFIEIRGCR